MSLLKRMQEPAVGQITQSSFTDILPVKCSMTTANVMMDLHAQDDLHIYNDIYKNAKFDVAGKLQNMIKIAAVKNQVCVLVCVRVHVLICVYEIDVLEWS